MNPLGDTWRIGGGEGLEAVILPYGAIVHSLLVPCRDGSRQVLANYATLEEYQHDYAYVGCIIGRTANRIRGARFSREGKIFRLTANDGGHSLHGGVNGFNRKVWSVQSHSADRLQMTCFSPDGDEGYPGAVSVGVSFEIVDRMSLRIRYEARCTRPTPVDLTHHLYFNLGGEGAPLAEHRLQVAGAEVLELDDMYLPTGRRLRVENTPFDLTRSRLLSSVLTAEHAQLTAIGLNQAWVLSEKAQAMRLVAPDSRLELRLETDQACLQLYSGLDATVHAGGALAVEPQGFINAVNETRFPSPWIEPRGHYERSTFYRFESK